MGLWDDLLYFGPAIGLRRGCRLLGVKVRKSVRKYRLSRALLAPEPEGPLLARVQLSADPEARLAELRGLWAELPAHPGLAPWPQEDPEPGARAVLAGRQVLFGQEVTVGWPPRWGWRWDDTPNASLLSGDVRSTWELQRLQGLLPLARAAARGGAAPEAETFAAGYLDAVLDFHRVHPGPFGLAWASALEVGLRLVALAQGLPLVAPTEAFGRAHLELLRMLDRHARWLRADLSLDKVVRGNHLLGELAGLTAAGYLLPDARGSWWAGLDVPRLLGEETLRQVAADGTGVEQSLTYEKFVAEFLVVAGSLAAARDRPFPEAVRERLAAAAAHLEAVTAPDGTLPRIGDCDSGRGADWGDGDPHRPGPLATRLQAVFGRRGEATELAQAREVPVEAAGVRVVRFPQGGHLVLRHPRGHFLFLRGGPFGWGIPGPASHSHADWLSPVLYLEGEPLWVDPGVFGYGVGADLRDADRDWEAHNALVFEESPGPYPAGTFRWEEIGPPAVVDLREEPEGVEIQGRVRWGRGAKSLLWHRSIRYNQLDDTWLIRDRTSGDIPGPMTWAFHFAPGVGVEEAEAPGAFRVRMPSGRTRTLRFAPGGTVVLEPGRVAPAYGRRTEAVVLRRRLDEAPVKSEVRLLPG